MTDESFVDGGTAEQLGDGVRSASRATERRASEPLRQRDHLWELLIRRFPPGREFTTRQVYDAAVPLLERLYPSNQNLDAKVRQLLQQLRDGGAIEFVERGRYRMPGGNMDGSELPPGRPSVVRVPVENQWTEAVVVEREKSVHEATRREQQLVHVFRDHLVGHGHEVGRLMIRPDRGLGPVFCDLVDWTTHTLFEAKGSVTRSAIRMAIGQLADYRRFVDPPPRTAVLLPAEPDDDLKDLIHSAGACVVWLDGTNFTWSEL